MIVHHFTCPAHRRHTTPGTCNCPATEVVTPDELVADLKAQLEHACRIAINAVGQPDRAEAVAHRNEIAKRLEAAQLEATTRLD